MRQKILVEGTDETGDDRSFLSVFGASSCFFHKHKGFCHYLQPFWKCHLLSRGVHPD